MGRPAGAPDRFKTRTDPGRAALVYITGLACDEGFSYNLFIMHMFTP